MIPILRPYQLDAIERILEKIRRGNRRVLLQIPTGGGKTIIASALIHMAISAGQRVLFLAHRLELIDQAVRQLERYGISPIGVIRSDDPRACPESAVQVASVQTLIRRLTQSVPHTDWVFVDECHRVAVGGSYDTILSAYPEANVIGLTATPVRMDGKPLGDIFEDIVHGARYADLIRDGYILEPTIYVGRKLPDLSNVKSRAGDYAEEQVEQQVTRTEIIGNVLDGWIQHAKCKKTVVFATTVQHSKFIVSIFQGSGIRADHLDGTTPEDRRAEILEGLRMGALELVSNVGVLTEGWDMPEVECVILARPTKSLGLYMQMAGRCLRPHGDKRPLILDHASNVIMHGFPDEDREWSLKNRISSSSRRSMGRVCETCYAYIRRYPCRFCGRSNPSADNPIQSVDGELEKANRTKVKPPPPGEHTERARYYRELETIALERGYKPGYVFFKFKERFGYWPPGQWCQQTKHKSLIRKGSIL